MKFIDTINVNTDLIDERKAYMEKTKKIELDKIINEENLKQEETEKYVLQAFNTGEMKSIGTDLVNRLPPRDMFNKGGVNREEKKQTVFQKLLGFFERFWGL
jgi:type I restriction enzyme R subunit